jgi:hypothetical protein
MRRVAAGVVLWVGLAVASVALTTCKGTTENRPAADRYYEPVDPDLMTVTVPLLTETGPPPETGSRADRYYEPVDPDLMTVTVPLLTETDLASP